MAYFQWKGLAGQLNTNAHGHLHELIGGSWNNKDVLLPETDGMLVVRAVIAIDIVTVVVVDRGV
jgi:hypothetical protein